MHVNYSSAICTYIVVITPLGNTLFLQYTANTYDSYHAQSYYYYLVYWKGDKRVILLLILCLKEYKED